MCELPHVRLQNRTQNTPQTSVQNTNMPITKVQENNEHLRRKVEPPAFKTEAWKRIVVLGCTTPFHEEECADDYGWECEDCPTKTHFRQEKEYAETVAKEEQRVKQARDAAGYGSW